MDFFSMVAAKGSYQFKIDHCKTKDMTTGKRIISPTFHVGPHDWAIRYYPQGNSKDYNGEYVSVFLELQGKPTDVTATFWLDLLDKDENISPTSLKVSSHTFTSHSSNWGFARFIKRTELEKTYVKDGYSILQVSITMKDKSRKGSVYENACPFDFLRERIQKFREDNIQTDVSFDVDGEKFVAHRLILAAHSPVFKAEFFGTMTESKLKCIQIKEMVPPVFEAMLDFIYNGSVNEKPIDDGESMSAVSFLQKLLASADRYAIEQLKAICEYKLIKQISLDTVFSLLESAEKHNCSDHSVSNLLLIKKNSVSLLFSKGYIKLMQKYPSLLAELKKMTDK